MAGTLLLSILSALWALAALFSAADGRSGTGLRGSTVSVLTGAVLILLLLFLWNLSRLMTLIHQAFAEPMARSEDLEGRIGQLDERLGRLEDPDARPSRGGRGGSGRQDRGQGRRPDGSVYLT